MVFDTEYCPKLAEEVTLEKETEKPVSFIIVEFDAREQSGDPIISIVHDNEINRSIIANLDGKIIGSGTSDIALPALIYGLQHPTRLLYKDTMSSINEFIDKFIKDKFIEDDRNLRETLNTVILNSIKN